MGAEGFMNPKKGYKKTAVQQTTAKGQYGAAGSVTLKEKHTPVFGKSKRERAYPPICGLQTGGRPFPFCRKCYLRSSSGSSGS